MQIKLVSLSDKRKPADLLIAGCFEGDKTLKSLAALEPDFSKAARSAFGSKRFSGKKGENLSSFNPDYREASEIILAGLGSQKKFDASSLRQTVGRLMQAARSKKLKRVRILLDTFAGGKAQPVQAAELTAETAALANYAFNKYKTKKKTKSESESEDGKFQGIETVELLLAGKGDEKKLQKSVEFARAVAEGTLTCRNLINEPGNIIHPASMVEETRKIARAKGLKLTVLGLSELKRLKMGGILGVNKGSKIPPALIILEHGTSHKSKGTVCIVGKGVTFDSGGISIKPSHDMEKMKYDKSGACAVVAAMGAAADLKLPVHVIALAPMVENMPGNDPQRPGDIITMYSGKTVEVINTDAEGRLILADALAYAEKFKPKALIDLATLTGMCAYTFGDKAIGLMGNDEKLLKRIKAAGEAAGERCWELPMWPEYTDTIYGHHSDLLNTGGKYGGTITAAKFLEEFVPEKTAWAHLDIAGTAWCDSPRYDCPKGATGVGVRLLVDLLKNWK